MLVGFTGLFGGKTGGQRRTFYVNPRSVRWLRPLDSELERVASFHFEKHETREDFCALRAAGFTFIVCGHVLTVASVLNAQARAERPS